MQELELYDDGVSDASLKFSNRKIKTIQADDVNTRTPSQILDIIGLSTNLIYPYSLGFIGASLLVGTLMSQKTDGFFPSVRPKSNQQTQIDKRCVQLYKIFLLGVKPTSNNIFHEISKVASSANNNITPFVKAGFKKTDFLEFYSSNKEKKVNLIRDQISDCTEYLLDQFTTVGQSTRTINRVAKTIDEYRIDTFITHIYQLKSLWKTR